MGFVKHKKLFRNAFFSAIAPYFIGGLDISCDSLPISTTYFYDIGIIIRRFGVLLRLTGVVCVWAGWRDSAAAPASLKNYAPAVLLCPTRRGFVKRDAGVFASLLPKGTPYGGEIDASCHGDGTCKGKEGLEKLSRSRKRCNRI
jgi:hypothetical protein